MPVRVLANRQLPLRITCERFPVLQSSRKLRRATTLAGDVSLGQYLTLTPLELENVPRPDQALLPAQSSAREKVALHQRDPTWSLRLQVSARRAPAPHYSYQSR